MKKNNHIIKNFNKFKSINENYEEQMEKEKVDDEFIGWLADEFDLNPEVVRSTAEKVGNDPKETYNILNKEVDEKGYGFDKRNDEDEDEEETTSYNFAICFTKDEMLNLLEMDEEIKLKSPVELIETINNFCERTADEDMNYNTPYFSVTEEDDYYYLILADYLDDNTELRKQANKDFKYLIKNLPKYLSEKFSKLNEEKWSKHFKDNQYVIAIKHGKHYGEIESITKMNLL